MIVLGLLLTIVGAVSAALVATSVLAARVAGTVDVVLLDRVRLTAPSETFVFTVAIAVALSVLSLSGGLVLVVAGKRRKLQGRWKDMEVLAEEREARNKLLDYRARELQKQIDESEVRLSRVDADAADEPEAPVRWSVESPESSASVLHLPEMEALTSTDPAPETPHRGGEGGNLEMWRM
jgi:hypothetical protein